MALIFGLNASLDNTCTTERNTEMWGEYKSMKIYKIKRLFRIINGGSCSSTNSKPLLNIISNLFKDFHSFVRTNYWKFDLTSEHNEDCVQCPSGCVALPREQPHRSKQRKWTRPRTIGVQKHVRIWQPSDSCPECCVLHENQNISLLLGKPGTFITRQTLHVRTGHIQCLMERLSTTKLEGGQSSRLYFR